MEAVVVGMGGLVVVALAIVGLTRGPQEERQRNERR